MKQNKSEFTIARAFDAPRERIWKALTDPKEMGKWWGPKGAKIISSTMNLRPGGTYLYGMQFEGREMWGKFVYQDIMEPEKIVFVNSFSDKHGGTTRHPMNANWPLELLSTFTLTEKEGKTTLTICWSLLPSATDTERKAFESGHSSMKQGWTGTLDQLQAYLA